MPMAKVLCPGEHQVTPTRGECGEGRGWDLCFFLVTSHQRRFVVMATTGRYFFHHLVVVLFGEGTMRRTGRGWDPSFFCCFVKSAHASAFGALMLPADLLPWFDALPPFVGGIPCRLFYCLRTTEPGAVLTTSFDGSPTPRQKGTGGT